MSEGDNLAGLSGDNRNPFKGPFNGKGANRQALRDLEAQMDAINEKIDHVIHRFNQTFAKPQPAHLRKLKRRSYTLMWWRKPGRSGNYIRLFDSDAGSTILDPLMPETKRVLKTFDEERISLNFLSTIVGNAIGAYRRRERDLLILEQYEQSED